jgi:AbrB family looped-hinge helix DNA binding protein
MRYLKMHSIGKIQRSFQVTIPSKLRKELNLKVGDIVLIEGHEDGILLKPQSLIDKGQTWFWSKEWQEEEKKIDEDFEKGDTLVSNSVDEFLKDLHEV